MKKVLPITLLTIILLTACAPTIAPTIAPQPYPASSEVPPASAPAPTPTQPAYPIDTPPTTSTPAQLAAVQALAQLLGIPPEAIQVVSTEEANWPDGCLGVAPPGVMCTAVIVPGFRIVLEAAGQQYEYRTNETGSQAVASPSDPAQTSAPAQAARTALAQALGIDENSITVLSAQLVSWMNSCLGVELPNQACAEMITSGTLVVLEADRRFYEYHTNADGSAVVPATVVLTWHREGGIAGFCDHLIVYAAGEVRASSCKGGAAQGNLAAVELEQLNQWLAQYSVVTLLHSDEQNVADGMTLNLTLNGFGGGQLTDAAEQDAVWTWAQTVYARLVK